MPKRTFLVSPHSYYTKHIQVYEVTNLVGNEGNPDDIIAEAFHNVEANMPAPCMSVDCGSIFTSRRQVYLEPSRRHLAEWKCKPWTRHSSYLNFSDEMGNQQVHMKPAHVMSRCEEFHFGGASFAWEQDSVLSSRHSTLLMTTPGGQQIRVAESAQSRRLASRTGRKLVGCLSLDDRQADWRLVVLSYLVVTFKILARRASQAGTQAGALAF